VIRKNRSAEGADAFILGNASSPTCPPKSCRADAGQFGLRLWSRQDSFRTSQFVQLQQMPGLHAALANQRRGAVQVAVRASVALPGEELSRFWKSASLIKKLATSQCRLSSNAPARQSWN